MSVLIVFVALALAACLIYAGGVEIERRAKNWERYEQWMHPPDDNGDGVTLIEEDDNENGR